MKRLILTTSAAIIFISVFAQTKQQRYLNELIAAENGFAKLSADSGVNKAFILSLDKESINFKRNKPVDGLTLWAARPGDAKNSLYWYPANAMVSAAGDLGITMGPGIFKPNADSARAFNSYFFSAWKKNKDGKFKVVLDGGCQRPGSVSRMEPKLTDYVPLANNQVTRSSNIKPDLSRLENDFVGRLHANATEAYRQYLLENAWVFRPGKIAGQNKQAGLLLISNPNVIQCRYTYAGGGIAASNDLAYAYGTVVLNLINNEGKSQQVNGFYIRAWQKAGNNWKIAGDMLSY